MASPLGKALLGGKGRGRKVDITLPMGQKRKLKIVSLGYGCTIWRSGTLERDAALD